MGESAELGRDPWKDLGPKEVRFEEPGREIPLAGRLPEIEAWDS